MKLKFMTSSLFLIISLVNLPANGMCGCFSWCLKKTTVEPQTDIMTYNHLFAARPIRLVERTKQEEEIYQRQQVDLIKAWQKKQDKILIETAQRYIDSNESESDKINALISLQRRAYCQETIQKIERALTRVLPALTPPTLLPTVGVKSSAVNKKTESSKVFSTIFNKEL